MVAACLAPASCTRQPAEAQAVVLVTLDTTRADHIGCYGYADVETPNLDRIATEGVLFQEATAVAPITLPAHTAMMTGRYPLANGVRNNGMYIVPDSERTLAEVLKGRGYQTAAFISGFPLSSDFGLKQGFDTYDETFDPPPEEPGANVDIAERDAGEATDAALAWLKTRKGGKFFLWVHYYDPHASYSAPSPWKERYANHPYDGEIAFVDHHLGRLLAGLAQAADPRRTVLAVVGDHGESLREHGEFFHGVLIYEAGLRVPFLLRAPGRISAGRQVAEPVSGVDVFPTLLDAAGLAGEAKLGPPIQGVDLVPVATGKAPIARPDLTAAPILAESLLSHLEFGWAQLHAIRQGSWKYIEAPQPELYDLATDPKETRNLLAQPGGAGPLAGSDAEGAAAEERGNGMRSALQAAMGAVGAAATASATQKQIDPAALEKLQSLGYMQGGGAAAPETASGASKDPKDLIGVYQDIVDLGITFRKGDLKAVAERCRELLRKEPDTPRVQWWLAESLFSLKEYDEVDRLVGPLLKKDDPSHLWVPGVLARTKEAQGDRKAAIELYRLALTKEPEYAKHAFRIAKLLYEEQDYKAALAQAREVIGRVPRHLPSLELAADCQRRAGNTAEAIDLWIQALKINPDEPVALAAAGPLLFNAGRYDEAQQVFDRLAKISPDRPEVPRFQGALAVLRRDNAGAIPLLRKASTAAPDDPVTRYWLGVALIRTGDLAGAEEQILPLVRERPGPEGFRALGLLRRAQGRNAEAIEAFRKVLSIAPTDPLSTRELKELGAGA